MLPVVLFSFSSYLAVNISLHVNTNGLKVVFGCLLILLAIYFFLFSDRISIKPSILSAVICSSLAGLMGGLFAIGGPLLVLYFLTITESKEEYMVSVNATLFLTNICQTLSRVNAGILKFSEIPAICVGICGITVGCIIGSKIADRINIDVMKRIIYAFLVVSGILTILNAIAIL